MLKDSYYSWFNKIISIFIELFFLFSILSTLYVFTTPLDSITRIIVFIILAIVFTVLLFLLKDKIKELLNKLLNCINKLDIKKMLLIIILLMIVLKIIYTIFYNFDATQSGDISIYNDIANSIINNSTIDNEEISHLIGLGLHLSLIKMLNIPLHIGIFIVFLLGTIINFISFKDIIGKDKTFLIIVIYILMPSTIMLTFCPTHELFVYLYYSLFGYVFSRFIKVDKNITKYLLGLLLIIVCTLCIMVNPAGYILLIILLLSILLSNINIINKVIIGIVIVLTLISSNMITNSFNFDETQTSLNTYSILIHGSNIKSNGEHVDGYPKDKAIEYINTHGMSDNKENRLIAMKEVLKIQYIELLTHPIDLIKLLIHKFYIYWSGDHYSLELAYSYNAVNTYMYYGMLGISSLLYLIIISLGFVLFNKKEDNIVISNYKLMLLGVMTMLLISLALNKYSVYMTIFIFLISFYRIKDDE